MLSREWIAAHEFTTKLGINIPPLPPDSYSKRKYLSSSFCDAALHQLRTKYHGQDLNQFLLKCFPVHEFLYNVFFDCFHDTPCYLTLGSVEHQGHEYFKHSREDIIRWISSRYPDPDHVEMHCWITFCSGEMVDATIQSVISYSDGRPSDAGEILWFQDEVSDDFIYHPTILSVEALIAMGLAKRA